MDLNGRLSANLLKRREEFQEETLALAKKWNEEALGKAREGSNGFLKLSEHYGALNADLTEKRKEISNLGFGPGYAYHLETKKSNDDGKPRGEGGQNLAPTELGYHVPSKLAPPPPPLGTPPPAPAQLVVPVLIPPKEAQEEKKDPTPASDNRKIIRTGVLDFEVDSFDAAADTITRLVESIKGGFIATTNSEKLANGKMRGAVVVRVPPEKLDRLVADLRRELGKIGELKSQKIGSQDVGKQYTDVESRLKAARNIEERLLNIIKTGKGEIKDLVAAEHELGTWRTKIEEMEGEIRYLRNQIALSTLTISLIERDIQAPYAIVVTERVGIRIEVEDVDQAQKGALAELGKVKGRLIKAELKPHAAGQLEAIIQAEVAPASAAAFRQGLQKLGNVTQHDAQRTQQAEGGGGKPLDVKPRMNDVHFEVTLYNTANIQPRETLMLALASADVTASYRKLQQAIAQAKGQVRTSLLNEQDKLNTTAHLEFDIPIAEKSGIDKVLAEVGQVLSRKNHRAAANETATDRKFGYRILVQNVAGIPPREKVSITIDVDDVDKRATELKDLVAASKGLVANANLDKQASGQVSAVLVFDIPLSSEDAVVRQFKAAGRVVSYKTKRFPQIPDNELATAQVEVTLRGAGLYVPSDEGLWPAIRSGLANSVKIFSWSVIFVITGLSAALPIALVAWIVVRIVRRMRGTP
jgi:hypothetical protein